MRTSLVVFLALTLAGRPLAAQASAAATITRDDVARRIGLIAHDSMLGRYTPSPGLEKTAQYVADEFKRVGLKPGGEAGGWFQRAPLSPKAGVRIDPAQSRVVFAAGGQAAAASFMAAAAAANPFLPPTSAALGVVAVAGNVTWQTKRVDVLKGKIALVVRSPGEDDATFERRMSELRGRYAIPGYLVVSSLDAASFARQAKAASQQTFYPTTQSGFQPTYFDVHLRVEAVPGLAALLAADSLDLARMRTDTTPLIHELPGLTVRFDLKSETFTAPNVVGILDGTDPQLKHEYLVIAAHMDHRGLVRGIEGDSVYNGADDNASGTAGVLELAEAFSQPGARPRRSIIFLTVSGRPHLRESDVGTGLARPHAGMGSEYFLAHPPVPLKQLVAHLDLDMIGRNWPDKIAVLGQRFSDLGATLDRVAAAHPELRLAPLDDRWLGWIGRRTDLNFIVRQSDQYLFARQGIPSLRFWSVTHPDFLEVTDEPAAVDADKAARVARLVFYLSREVGTQAARPQWDPASYQTLVKEEVP